ncbi:MAG: YgaP family membrane protein [Gammaproteobacteria bacterium]
MTKNVGTIDKVIRIVAGGALIAWAAAFGGPVWAYIGIVPVATALLGICPAYSIIGVNTRGK